MSVQSGVICKCIVAHVKLQVVPWNLQLDLLQLNNQIANTHSTEWGIWDYFNFNFIIPFHMRISVYVCVPTGKDVSDRWYNEVNQYNFNQPGFSSANW